MKEQLTTMKEMLEKVDVEEAQGKTDGMIGNLVAEVNNLYLLYNVPYFLDLTLGAFI